VLRLSPHEVLLVLKARAHIPVAQVTVCLSDIYNAAITVSWLCNKTFSFSCSLFLRRERSRPAPMRAVANSQSRFETTVRLSLTALLMYGSNENMSHFNPKSIDLRNRKTHFKNTWILILNSHYCHAPGHFLFHFFIESQIKLLHIL